MQYAVCVLMVGLAQPTSSDLADAMAVLDRVDAARISLDAHDEPLSQVILELGAQCGAPLRADWPALARLGVNPDTMLTLKVVPTSGLRAMSAVAVALGDEFERPVFEAHAGGMVFTTINGAAAMRLTGVYDVRDLLVDSALVKELRESAPMLQPSGVEPADVDADDQPGNAGEAAGGAGPATGDDRPLSPGEQLIMLVTDHIDPEAWANFGGDRSRISERDGVVILTAAPTIHRQLQAALDLLRKANPRNLVVEAAILDVPRGVYERISRVSGTSTAATSASFKSAPESVNLWRAAEPISLGGTLSTASSSKDTKVQVSISPHFDAEAGLLRIDVDASTNSNGDERHVKTTAALAGGASDTVVELPATGTPEFVRLLLLTVRPK